MIGRWLRSDYGMVWLFAVLVASVFAVPLVALTLTVAPAPLWAPLAMAGTAGLLLGTSLTLVLAVMNWRYRMLDADREARRRDR